MKCSACWAEKAYRRRTTLIRERLLEWLGLVPLKCHHCYHKFWVPCVLAWGQTLEPPPRKAAPGAGMASAVPPRRAA